MEAWPSARPQMLKSHQHDFDDVTQLNLGMQAVPELRFGDPCIALFSFRSGNVCIPRFLRGALALCSI
jgi:hypothetical protein